MRVDPTQQGYPTFEHNSTGGPGGELNRQEWLREIEKAHAAMVKNMRAVTPGSELSADGAQQETGSAWASVVAADQTFVLGMNESRQLRVGNGSIKPLTTSSALPVSPHELDRSSTMQRFIAGREIAATFPGPAIESSGEIEAPIRAAVKRADPSGETWNAQNLHIETVQDGVVVWMRNAELGREDEARITAQLRRNLSGLGVRLCGLYLNGHSVTVESQDSIT